MNIDIKLLWWGGTAERTNKEFLKWETIFSRFLREGDWCIDIGANNGILSLAMVSSVGYQGKIICVEPHPELCHRIKSQFVLNNYKNVDVHEIGFAEKDCIKTFRFSHSLENGAITNSHKEVAPYDIFMDIACRNPVDFLLEKYSLEDLKKVVFVKIDCEGYDYIILKTLMPFLKIIRPIIMVEKFPDPKIQQDLKKVIEENNLEILDVFTLHPVSFDSEALDFILTFNDYE